MADTDWEPLVPANTDQISTGAEDIRELKEQIAVREAIEHVAWAGAGVGGEHKEGSAMVYYAASDDTPVRPDGATSLSSADKGRIRFNSDDQLIRVYSGSDWVTAGYEPTANFMTFNDGVNHVIDETPVPVKDGLSIKTTGDNPALKVEATYRGDAIEAISSGGSSGYGSAILATSTDKARAVTIKGEGTGTLLYLHPDSTCTSAIYFFGMAGNTIGIDISSTSSQPIARLTQTGSGDCVQASLQTSSAIGNCFDANLGAASHGDGLYVQSSAGANGVGVNLVMGASDKAHILMDASSFTGTDAGSFWNDGVNLHYSDGTTNHDIPISTKVTGDNTSANGTVAVNIGGETFYLLKAETADLP